MKKFNIRKGIFLKSKDTIYKRNYTLTFILFLFLLLRTFISIYLSLNNKGNLYTIFYPLIYIIISIIIFYNIENIYYNLIKNKKTSSYIFNNIINYCLIISLLLPEDILIYKILIINIISVIIKILTKNYLNPIVIPFIILNINTPIWNITNTFYIIYLSLCILSFIYLILKKYIKYKIPITYLITLILLGIIINLDITNYLNILPFILLFILPHNESTSVKHNMQIIYGIFASIITILTNNIFIAILIANIVYLIYILIFEIKTTNLFNLKIEY